MHEEGHTPENNFRRKASLPADVQNPVKGSSTQSTASNTLASSLVRSSRIRRPSLKLRDGDPDHGQSTESLASNTSPSPGCSSCSRHPSSPTITSTSSDVRSLLDFLRSVCPLLMSAAGSMVEAGIKDEMCFRALAEWPARERDTLLLDEVRLTPFQLSLVRVVLGKMRKHENVIEID
ncbi:hypothetical protein SCP_0203590 [Sparassis crispa]|uniref:Uncharacterized protein n=1 Tax=Sparassis crispa TaxID=139825 RepID=A0A401GAH5_9APHY|nr:hypothetical protein SCP_0203590 [Sparassis crispa]GBE79162.1 hypothetical protein SCP_0203590 [Sparassis crispa]